MDEEERIPLSKPIKTEVLKRRWIVLATYCLLSVSNNNTMYSFSPIPDLVKHYYGKDDFMVNLLALVFFVSGFTFRFPAMWILDSVGLGLGIYIAAVANFIGVWLRYYPGSHEDGYWWVFAGQSVCALGMAFIDISVPKVSAAWFPPHERSTATAIGSIPMYLALLLGYLTSTFFVKNQDDIPTYLFATAIAGSLVLVLVLIFFRGKPPIPPSYSAAKSRLDFVAGVTKIFHNINFVYLFLIFCTAGGIAASFSTLLPQILHPAGYSKEQAGAYGALWVGAAMMGGFICGLVVDRTHKYKLAMLSCIGPLLVMLLIFVLAVEFLARPYVYVMGVICTLLGFTGAAVPAILEATVETTYPVAEGTVMGVLFFGMNITAAGFIILLTDLKGQNGNMNVSNWVIVGVSIVSTLFVILFKEKNKRLEFEQNVERTIHEEEEIRRSIRAAAETWKEVEEGEDEDERASEPFLHPSAQPALLTISTATGGTPPTHPSTYIPATTAATHSTLSASSEDEVMDERSPLIVQS